MLISKDVKAVKKDDRNFIVQTPKRTYHFKGLEDYHSDEWVKAINNIINQY